MTTKLREAYVQWSDEPFPHGSARDDIDELYAELATVDLWVTTMVIPYVEHGQRFPLKVDIDGGIRSLKDRIRELCESARGEDRILLDRYAFYVDLLDALFRAYKTDSHTR